LFDLGEEIRGKINEAKQLYGEGNNVQFDEFAQFFYDFSYNAAALLKNILDAEAAEAAKAEQQRRREK